VSEFNSVILVSVLITAYNRENYISEAIESVLASSFKNFEVIIVDDCSNDRTFEIAKKFEMSDSRVKVFVNEQNLGDYPNRNKAASYAKGKYIKYVDADDYIYPNGLEIIVNQMESNPSAAVGLFSLPQDFLRPFPILLSPTEAFEYNFFGRGLFHKAALSAIFRKDAFDKSGGFMPQRMTGDFEIWHRMAQKYSFLLIQDHIVWYREHDSQESNSINLFELDYIGIEKKYIYDVNSPLSKSQRKLIIRKRIVKYLKSFIFSCVKLNLGTAILSFSKLMMFVRWKK
jgi:glycosyltransferase involved in cell wall biosynthesis